MNGKVDGEQVAGGKRKLKWPSPLEGLKPGSLLVKSLNKEDLERGVGVSEEDVALGSTLSAMGFPPQTVARCLQLTVAPESALTVTSGVKQIKPFRAFHGGPGGRTVYAKGQREAYAMLYATGPGTGWMRYEWNMWEEKELNPHWVLCEEPTKAAMAAVGWRSACACCQADVDLGWSIGEKPTIGRPGTRLRVELKSCRMVDDVYESKPIEAVWGVEEVVCVGCWEGYARGIGVRLETRRREMLDYASCLLRL